MRRMPVLLSVVAVVLLGAVAAGRSTLGSSSHDATPAAALAGHPIVGAWRLTDPAFPDDPLTLVHFYADGTYLQAEADGPVGVGSWEATGERGVAMTFLAQFGDEAGGVFALTIRAAGEVDAGGDAFAGTYTAELALPDGTSRGEFEPGTVAATRMAVEPMGTPAGPIEALFGQFAGSPAAGTPAP